MSELAARRPAGVGVRWGAGPEVAVAGERCETFYDDVYPDLAGYCWTLVHDRELAQDIAQEAFMRLFARWVRVREPRPYLFHVATTLGRDAWRGRIRAQQASRQAAAQLHEAPVGDLAAAFTVQRAIESLPARYREVVLLHYFADLTVDDVAAAVRRPAGTVKRQLSEARALLAPLLEAARA